MERQIKQLDEKYKKEKDMKAQAYLIIREKTDKAFAEYKQKQKQEQINKYHWNADERVKKLEIQSKSDTVWTASNKEHQEKVRWEKTLKRKMSTAGDEVSLKRKAELESKSKTNAK